MFARLSTRLLPNKLKRSIYVKKKIGQYFTMYHPERSDDLQRQPMSYVLISFMSGEINLYGEHQVVRFPKTQNVFRRRRPNVGQNEALLRWNKRCRIDQHIL